MLVQGVQSGSIKRFFPVVVVPGILWQVCIPARTPSFGIYLPALFVQLTANGA